jgi:hypothetical protein
MEFYEQDSRPIYLGHCNKEQKYYFYMLKGGVPRFLTYATYFFWSKAPTDVLEFKLVPDEIEVELQEFLEGKIEYEFTKLRKNSNKLRITKVYRYPVEVGAGTPGKGSAEAGASVDNGVHPVEQNSGMGKGKSRRVRKAEPKDPAIRSDSKAGSRSTLPSEPAIMGRVLQGSVSSNSIISSGSLTRAKGKKHEESRTEAVVVSTSMGAVKRVRRTRAELIAAGYYSPRGSASGTELVRNGIGDELPGGHSQVQSPVPVSPRDGLHELKASQGKAKKLPAEKSVVETLSKNKKNEVLKNELQTKPKKSATKSSSTIRM